MQPFSSVYFCRRRAGTALFAAALLVVAGCDFGGTETIVGIDGRWQGSASVQTDTSSFRLELSATIEQDERDLGGTARVSTLGGSAAPVSGTLDGRVENRRTVVFSVVPEGGDAAVLTFRGQASEATGRIEGAATYRPLDSAAPIEVGIALARTAFSSPSVRP